MMMINEEPAILCVDDEVIILDTLKEQLQRQFKNKYVYEMAENVSEAWEIINELYEEGIRILIIVSDWLMPGIKGDEFLIKVHQKFPEITTIMLTGEADENAVDKAFQHANLFACLRKPWKEEELIGLVSSALK